MTRVTFFAALAALLSLGVGASASAQSYPLVRSVRAPTAFVPQASFYNPVRDELVVLAYDGVTAQVYDGDGDLVRAAAPLPSPLGDAVDGAAYDTRSAVALVVRHNCEVIELDPVDLSVRSRRVLGGSGIIAAPSLCAGVDVASDGSLLVADHITPRVLVYPREGSVPTRVINVGLTGVDNLARAPGTTEFMVATNTGGVFALFNEAGVALAGPSVIGTGIILGTHTRSNTAGSDGLTFMGTTGRLWFCDHNASVDSCYVQTRGCARDEECAAPFVGCDTAIGQCRSPVCGDARIEGGEECDDGGTVGGDGCSAACVVEPGYVCNGAPSVCGMCTDTSPTGTDTGCTAAQPHCRLTGPRAPRCEICLDDGAAIDLGCTATAPLCVRDAVSGTNACLGCISDTDCDDANECTSDACAIGVCGRTPVARGTACAAGFCDGASACVTCVEDSQCGAGERCDATGVCVLTTDTGVALDAAVPPPDAFVPEGVDAGPIDSGVAPLDAASAPDATTVPTGGSFVGGAACHVGTGAGAGTGARAAWGLALAALAMLVARRRVR